MMNILLPTDFSENSKNAAAYALQFFKDIPCNFFLLHVLPVSEKLETDYINVSPPIQEKFNDLLEWLTQLTTNPQHHFHITFKANFLIESVREQVLEKGIDLILMGTKGSTNKEDILIGKNTSDVMMKVKCPVLAISENAIYKEHKEILFPTDYKIRYNSKMLEALLNLSSLSKASIKIVELFSSKKEPSVEQITNRIFLQSSFASNTLILRTLYSEENIDTNSIFSENKNVDMIVMAAKNLNICHRLLNSKQQNAIPFINKLPLLILH